MKKEFFVLAVLAVSAIFLISFISADIIILQNPANVYNLGDMISIPVKITSLTDTGNPFTIKLICNGEEIEVHKEYIMLSPGAETERNPPIPLIKNFIGDLSGNCAIKYVFGDEIKKTNEFVISNRININITSSQKDFSPEEQIVIEGVAKKINGDEVNGFVEMQMYSENGLSTVSASNTVKNGLFTLTFIVPKDTASNNYAFSINVYEKDSSSIVTNIGSVDYRIFIKQISSSLEIILDNEEVEPGTVMKTRAILHDQTGQPISSTSTITIINNNGKTVGQNEISNDGFLEITIPSGESPGKWTIKAESNGLVSQSYFTIKPVEKISTEIIKSTLMVTNIGNVPYNKSVMVKIGDKPMTIDVDLDVGEFQKYSLSAPNGEYDVDIIVNGKSNLNEKVLLTGSAVNLKKSGISFENNTIAWIIIIVILAFFGVKIIKKLYNKRFFGYLPGKDARPVFVEAKRESILPISGKSSLTTKNKAELELSIKGDKQDISLICLKIKNLNKLKESKTKYAEILQNVIEMAEAQKIYIYGTPDNIFFLHAPIKTKTFKNERAALNLAQKISGIMNSYNKLAKEKISFGLSVTYGAIVANASGNVLKFMAMGNLMNVSKKIASFSEGEVLLSDAMRAKLGSDIKTQKKETSSDIPIYALKEVRNDERAQEFIRRFMNRMDKG